MADFGALEYALVDGLVFDTTAGTYDSGTLEAALVDGWVLVAAVAGGMLAFQRSLTEGGTVYPALTGGMRA